MNSKQALEELKENAKNEVSKFEIDRLKIIEEDLYTLEILRKYVRYDDENHVIIINTYKKNEVNLDYKNEKE